ACTTARCRLDAARAGEACAGEAIPPSIGTKIDKALGKLAAAAVGTPKKARSLTFAARALLTKAGRAALRASKGRRARISIRCGKVLSTTCRDVATGR